MATEVSNRRCFKITLSGDTQEILVGVPVKGRRMGRRCWMPLHAAQRVLVPQLHAEVA
jgi:hypothetical protein